jgi:hypothetical protein
MNCDNEVILSAYEHIISLECSKQTIINLGFTGVNKYTLFIH